MIWQIRHDFISLDFLQGIHARDVQEGRTEGYLLEQFVFCANILTLPFWLAGLYYYFFSGEGRRFRLMGWLYVIPFGLYLIAQGRSYYQAPAYPMLIAAGAVMWERWRESLSAGRSLAVLRTTWGMLVAGTAFSAILTLPIAPIGSPVFKFTAEVHDLFTEQIGWPEMVRTVADIYAVIPAQDKAHTGILTAENDEAAALNLFGPAYGLPKAISGSDTFWLRGYGDPPPETLIVLGFDSAWAQGLFSECQWAGRITNAYGIANDLANPPDIFLCRKPRLPWPELWNRLKHYS